MCGVVCSLRRVGKTAGLPEALQGVLRGLEVCVEWCVAWGVWGRRQSYLKHFRVCCEGRKGVWSGV